LALEWHGPAAFVTHAFVASPALYLAAAGVLVAWFLYMYRPALPGKIKAKLGLLNRVLVNKYYFDWFNEQVLSRGTRGIAGGLSRVGDQLIIDGLLVNGSARVVETLSGVLRKLQSGYLYTYAFAMVIGLAVLAGWLIVGQ
ncbi:MAG: NADH-quinone oxidoreductase subunit L, partial [Gammaproteobacteria bacterium]|nr:NADH-quinone oxidoreductase subunit L [Gammaproteobacteria bacterium]